MTPSSLDARLSRLYRGLDTSPGFDAGVIARVHAEWEALEAESRARARAAEMQRYELARRRQSWGSWFRRIVTPNTLGAVAVTGLGIVTLWTRIQTQAAPAIAAHAPLALTAVGIGLSALGIALSVAAPVLMAQAHRRMSRIA
jgi:hypothetical protein